MTGTDIDKIKDAMRDVMAEHHCTVFTTEEDRVAARDLVKVGKKVKVAIISALSLFILNSLGVTGYVTDKVVASVNHTITGK